MTFAKFMFSSLFFLISVCVCECECVCFSVVASMFFERFLISVCVCECVCFSEKTRK